MIDYRDADAADAPALDTMAQAVWMETFGHSASAEDIATYLAGAYGPEGALTCDLATGRAQFRLALEGDRIIGYAKLAPAWLPDAERGAMQLCQLYVVGEFQGAGIAHALTDWTIETARAAGAGALLLTVWEQNHRAIGFYKKRGFVHSGYYAFAVGQQVDNDHIMRLAL